MGWYVYQGNQGVSYANPDAVTGIGNGTATSTYAYDNNGNLASGGGVTNSWNYLNQMLQSVASSSTSTYAYDYSGSRVKMVASSTTSFYPNQYFTQTGTTSEKDIYANGALAASISNKTGSTTTYWDHPDYLGSTNVISNPSGLATENTTYYPFGQLLSDGKSTSFSESRKYIGQQFDTPTSYDYLNARYYNSTNGRFVSEDPMLIDTPTNSVLANPQTFNYYAYSGNNPIIKSDPSGLFWWKEFYTDWDGYDITRVGTDNGLILKAGEVFGGRFAAQDAISANQRNISNSSSQTGVSPSTYSAIMYEENSHQFPPFGGERMIENVAPQLSSGGVGAMQVSSKTSGLSNSALLNDTTNVNAGGSYLASIQSQHGTNSSVVGSYYNSLPNPASAHASSYGQRVNTYTTTSFTPTIADKVVRTSANIAISFATKGITGTFISAVSSNIITMFKSFFK